jgi:serine/threonine protein kinase
VLKSDDEWRPPADIWAVGVIAFALLFGCRPFRAPTPYEELQCLLVGRYAFPTESRHVSARAKDFIARTLCVNPARRPTASELVQHPWLQPRLCDEETAVFVLACHPRCGELSPAANQPSEIFRKIMFLSLNKEDFFE